MTPAAGISATATCSKCEKPLDTKGYPRWCQHCRTTYRSELNDARLEISKIKGFTAGVESMRSFLAENFGRYNPPRVFSSNEIAQIIMRVTGPGS